MKDSLAPGVLVEDTIILEYTHLDLIWGLDAPYRVFEKVVTKLIEFEMGHGLVRNLTVVV